MATIFKCFMGLLRTFVFCLFFIHNLSWVKIIFIYYIYTHELRISINKFFFIKYFGIENLWTSNLSNPLKNKYLSSYFVVPHNRGCTKYSSTTAKFFDLNQYEIATYNIKTFSTYNCAFMHTLISISLYF